MKRREFLFAVALVVPTSPALAEQRSNRWIIATAAHSLLDPCRVRTDDVTYAGPASAWCG